MKLKIFTKIFQFLGGWVGNSSLHIEKTDESVINTPKTEEFERCIMCEKLTCVPVSMPIDWRGNYEIGCGQLCAECAKKQREATIGENTLTNAQIILAVEQSRKENDK